jgi:hypothetical protein
LKVIVIGTRPSFGSIVAPEFTTPCEQPSVSGSPSELGTDEKTHSVASDTVAERFTNPPCPPSDVGEAVKLETVGPVECLFNPTPPAASGKNTSEPRRHAVTAATHRTIREELMTVPPAPFPDVAFPHKSTA